MIRMIGEDIELARYLHRAVEAHPELEAGVQGLSVTTYRYVPPDLSGTETERETYLNRLNEALLHRLESSRQVFLSRAVIRGRFQLRACVVNFRTTDREMDTLVDLSVRYGRELHAAGGARIAP
jgi:glutamate/tyrosine decarboxylase-like PLP-dependent enzyme